MGCRSCDKKMNDYGFFKKMGFYALRTLLYLISVALTPVLFLVCFIILFELIVLNKPTNSSVIFSLFPSESIGGKSSEEDEEDLDNLKVYEVSDQYG